MSRQGDGQGRGNRQGDGQELRRRQGGAGTTQPTGTGQREVNFLGTKYPTIQTTSQTKY